MMKNYLYMTIFRNFILFLSYKKAGMTSLFYEKSFKKYGEKTKFMRN